MQERKEERNVLSEIDSVNRNHTFSPPPEAGTFQALTLIMSLRNLK